IRLPFLIALRRRGYQPEAFVKYALSVGVTLVDKHVDKDEFFKVLNAFNKEIIDPKSDRYFFIYNPTKIKIENAPKQEIELDLYPDKRKGGRFFSTADKFYLTEEDFKSLKDNELYRLMDCLNFVKKGDSFIFDSLDYNKFKEKGKKIMHWLPVSDNLVQVKVLMPDNTFIEGLGEEGLRNVDFGKIVQFERFGFCRLDNEKGNKLIFWFSHK
ncbi:MAG: hypothetical protein N3D84_02530, partial [Candidatus Woesearchaeota archaeon]|nr:hypothetical protein [Candidatus Woesearchaeota archaeon]